ncbi:MAG: hypothetical protein GY757_30905 [bacterium]|nr:hypothetical protein [bacterium]
MKKTKLPKKLVLNKKTVTNLDFLQQKMIKGGHTCVHETCVTECETCEICTTFEVEKTIIEALCPPTKAGAEC